MSRMDRVCGAIGWFLIIVIILAVMLVMVLVSWKIPAIIAVFALVYCGARGQIVEPKTKVLFGNLFGNGMREAGPGLVVPLPWERIATINESQVHSIQKQVLDVKLDVEAENEEFVTLDMSIIYRIANLAKYTDFKPEDFKESVKEYAKSFATDIGRGCKDLDEIYEKVRNGVFESGLLSKFRDLMPSGDATIEGHHGIGVVSVIISDPELPAEVKKAAQEKMVAEKRAEAQKQEMLGVRRMAQLMVAQEKRNGKVMSLDRAIYLVQRQFGKTESVEEFGLSPDTLKTIENTPHAALPVWLSAFFNRLSKANSGKRGPGRGDRSQKGGK